MKIGNTAKMTNITLRFENIRGVPILNEFVKNDWPRFQRFWFQGIWSWLPFMIVSRKRLSNMHWDVADHAMYFQKKQLTGMLKQIEISESARGDHE